MKYKNQLTFEQLYEKIIIATETHVVDEDLARLKYDPHHLECVLKPTYIESILECPPEKGHCSGKSIIDCLFDNLVENQNHVYEFSLKNTRCPERMNIDIIPNILASKDLMEVLSDIRKGGRPIYAAIAPAFLSQFDGISDDQLRTAFKRFGFSGMVEVSLFADILTLKEALEFDEKIHDEHDYMLTSCCCPMWIQMIRKVYPQFLEKIPGSVSPMIAAGRVIKRLVPNAVTVFIGPCLAKKAEAKETDIMDAIDHVLTFKEIKDLFDLAKIGLDRLESDLREHSSYAGRIYAITKGVSESVSVTLNRIRPDKEIKVISVQGDGVVECKKLLNQLDQGALKANFIEGMGCVGGCVGGPRAIADKSITTEKVKKYAKESLYKTPIDNPYVIELLHRLGIHTIEALLEDQEVFTRHFNENR